MQGRYDVAVIGGGIVGCAAALELVERGLNVVLIEKGRCGQGASGVNFGGVRQQGRHAAELPLSLRANRLWPELSRRLGTEIEYVRTGHIKLARSEQDVVDLENYARLASKHGLALTMLAGRHLREQFPWLGPSVLAASYSPEDGQANPRLVAPAFKRSAERRGAVVLEQASATFVSKSGGIFSIDLGTGKIEADIVINAAGPGGAAIARQFGEIMPLGHMVPNMLVTEPIRHFIEPAIGVCGGDIYIRQIDRGNVIFGGGDGVVDATTGFARPDIAQAMTVGAKAVSLIPALASAAIIRIWSGVEALMPDHLPVFGPSTTTAGLIHAFGFSGHGFQLGPVVGGVLADLVISGTSDLSLEPFLPGRFVSQAASMEGTS